MQILENKIDSICLVGCINTGQYKRSRSSFSTNEIRQFSILIKLTSQSLSSPYITTVNQYFGYYNFTVVICGFHAELSDLQLRTSITSNLRYFPTFDCKPVTFIIMSQHQSNRLLWSIWCLHNFDSFLFHLLEVATGGVL